jgi:hypothetical protein
MAAASCVGRALSGPPRPRLRCAGAVGPQKNELYPRICLTAASGGWKITATATAPFLLGDSRTPRSLAWYPAWKESPMKRTATQHTHTHTSYGVCNSVRTSKCWSRG